MTSEFISNTYIQSIYGLTLGRTFEEEFSKVSLENLLFDIISFCVFVHEQIVSKNAENSRPQNIPNFILTVLNFRDGLDLKWKGEQFQYDLSGVTDAEERKIIDRCAVLESNDGELVVKVATDNDGVLFPITTEQLTRLEFYLSQMKVPGVSIRMINKVADTLKATLDVYVDPLMIDLNNGKQLNVSGDVYPVKDAIKDYLSNLEFNGAFVKNYMIRNIEQKDGIKMVDVNLLQHSFDSLPFVDIDSFKIPESGYFDLDDTNLTITYLPYALVNN